MASIHNSNAIPLWKTKGIQHFLRQFFIAVLGEDDVERVKSAAKSVPVDNETVEWDCQDYVLEILDKLQEVFILDKDDEDYIDVREILMEERGGIV